MGGRMRRWRRWLVAGPAAAVLLLVGGPFVYIHFIEGRAPAPLTLSSPAGSGASSDPTGAATTDGTWKVASGSLVGYRVKEVLFGQSNVAVGRTGHITGSITVRGTTVTGGSLTVEMATVTSAGATSSSTDGSWRPPRSPLRPSSSLGPSSSVRSPLRERRTP